jgi:hypothetical protein
VFGFHRIKNAWYGLVLFLPSLVAATSDAGVLLNADFDFQH